MAVDFSYSAVSYLRGEFEYTISYATFRFGLEKTSTTYCLKHLVVRGGGASWPQSNSGVDKRLFVHPRGTPAINSKANVGLR